MLRYLTTVRREINVLVGASLLTLVIKILWLNTIPEWFPWGEEVGEIVDRLCASALSSYLFYLIVVHLKSEKDKVAVNPYIAGKVRHIVDDCESQLSKFGEESDMTLTLETLTRENIEESFRKINPQRRNTSLYSRDSGEALNWLQYMDYYRERTSRSIEKLFRKVTYLDSGLIRCLASIDDCEHFTKTSFFVEAHTAPTIPNMEILAPSFFDYCVLARTLGSYEKSKLAIY